MQAAIEYDFAVQDQNYRLQFVFGGRRRLFVIQALQFDSTREDYLLHHDFEELQAITELLITHILYAGALGHA